MKRISKIGLSAIVYLMCLSLVASAQTTGTLSKEDRKSASKYLDETRKKFLDSIKGLSEAQWKFKSALDRWSVAEVAEHIALSEDML